MAPPRQSYRSRNPKRQTRLQFSTLPSSSPNKNDYSPAVQDRLSRVTYMGARKKEQDGAEGLLTPEPSSQPQAESDTPSRRPRRTRISDDEDELITLATQNETKHNDLPGNDDEDDVITPATKKKPRTVDTPISDAEDELATPVPKKRKISGGVVGLRRSTRLNSSPTPARSESPVVISDNDSGIGEAETTDEEGDVLASAPTRRRKAITRRSKSFADPTETFQEDWVVDDDVVEYASSDSEPVQRKRKHRRNSQKEKEELEADLADLQDSDVEDSARKRRTRGGPVTTQRDGDQEHFDLLKRRRAGQKIPRVYDPDEDEEDEEDEEEGADIEFIGRPTQFGDGDSVHSSVDTEPEEEDVAVEQAEDDWIDNDEQEVDNDRRPQSGVPLRFTRFATLKPRELFFFIVEWLVKNRIAPAFPRDDEIYTLSFRKVDDEVSAQAGSRLISSAWNAEFKYTILARPEIAISAKEVEDDIHCDACNKKKHPAKYDVVMSGQPYYAKTLEPIEPDSDNENDGMDVDEMGRLLASETKHFYLGTHCAANAQMGHTLSHWKYSLNRTILEHLKEQDVLSDQQIVAREKKTKKQRENEAEAIVDSMEDTGKIKELWREFQRDLKDARLGMVDYDVGKGARSSGRVGIVQTRTEDGMVKEWNGDRYRQMRADSTDSDY